MKSIKVSFILMIMLLPFDALAQEKDGVYFTGTYLFTNSAITLGQSESMLAWNIYGPQYLHGITENIQVGITTTWLFSPLVFEAKGAYSFSEKLHVGATGIWGVEWIEEDPVPASLLSATFTFGDTHTNVSSTLYGIKLTDDELDSGTLLSISGYHKLNRTRAIFMETFLIDIASRDVGSVVIPGMQFLTKRNRMLNLGLVNIFYEDVYILVPIPFLQLQVPFN